MKRLVVCPNCEAKSGTSIRKWVGQGFNIELKRPGGMVLGQVTDDGSFLIKRGGENYTKIIGDNFMVLCGNCGNPVYRKEANGTNSYQRESWLYREASFATGGSVQAIGS